MSERAKRALWAWLAVLAILATAALVLAPRAAKAQSPRLELRHSCGPIDAMEEKLRAHGYALAERALPDAMGDRIERWARADGEWVIHLRADRLGLVCWIYEGRGWTAETGI